MYYDVLAKLKNAVMARKDRVVTPFSKMDFAVLTALHDAGYIAGIEKEMIGKKAVIVIRLAARDKKKAFSDFKLVSKPSRHTYIDYRKIRPVLQGHGTGVLSTSKGIMTDRTARKNKIGGEYLFQVW